MLSINNADRTIYVVDDEESIQRLLDHWVREKWGYTLRTFGDGESCLDEAETAPDLIILDIMLPGIGGIDALKVLKQRFPELPVIMLSAQGRIEVAVESLKLGASDYFSKPIDFQKLEISIKNCLEMHDLAREVVRLRAMLQKGLKFDNIVSVDGTMKSVFALVNKAKESDISVLIQGESGSGKELIARALHFTGKRRTGPFVVVNCASLPRDLLESEIFGHERGAFTGAIQRKIGKFEFANGGTIFLDEIGELDFSLQAKLLRIIQTKQFERVGGNVTISTDVRIVSATNRDLMLGVKEKTFREDLFYRLSAFMIQLPSLRERRADILLLAEHFMRKSCAEQKKATHSFSRKTLKMLYEYPWPGNVRELEHAIEHSVLMAEQETIQCSDLPMAVQAFSSGDGETTSLRSLFSDNDIVLPFEKMKEEGIRHALKVTHGNVLEAAKRLKIGRATLYRLIERYKIES